MVLHIKKLIFIAIFQIWFISNNVRLIFLNGFYLGPVMFTCIVVDDDVNTTKVFSDILELMGLQVVGKGYSGSEAVCLYKQYRPDVVFIDLTMPKTDGFYAIQKILEVNPAAKIVAVTANLTLETDRKLEKLKINAIIRKPFSTHEIKHVLEQYKINPK